MYQTLDPGGDIIMDKIILPRVEFETSVLMTTHLGKSVYLKGRNPYEYSKEILDRDVHTHHHLVVLCILHYEESIYLIIMP